MDIKYYCDHPIHGEVAVLNRTIHDNERVNAAPYCVYSIVLYAAYGKGRHGQYIGFTSNLQKRLRDHIGDARRPVYPYIRSSSVMLVHIVSIHDTEVEARAAETYTINTNAVYQAAYLLINKHHNK